MFWWKLLLALVAFNLLLLSAVMGWESIYIGLLATPEVVDGYHFGTESMVGHGGWKYRSHMAYVVTAAIEAALLTLASIAMIRAAFQLNRRNMLMAGISLAIALIAIFLPL